MTQPDDIVFYNQLAAAKTIFLPLRKKKKWKRMDEVIKDTATENKFDGKHLLFNFIF